MVAILPPKQNLGTLIGAAGGQGLASGIERGAQQGFNRGQLQRGLRDAIQIAQNPNATPLERTAGFLQAFAGIPGSERYVKDILPMLNQMAEFAPQAGNPNAQGGLSPAANPQTLQNPSQISQGITGGQSQAQQGTEPAFPQEEVDLYEPFLGPNVRKFSPQEIQAQETRDYGRGLQSSPRADQMRKSNQEIENAVAGISQKQKDFADYYSAIHPQMSPDDQRIAQKFSRTKDALKAPTNQEKARVVDNFVDRYRALKTNIANQNPRSLVDKTRADQEGELHNQIDWLLKEGQRDLAKEYLTSTLKFGDAESERIIQKPTKQQEDLLTKFNKLPELSVKVPEFGKNARQFQTYNKARSEAIGQYEDRMEKAIKPGTAKQPGTSLLVLRDLAMETGMTWTEFNDTVNKLIKEDRITLDPYQTSELPKLTHSPINGFWDMLIGRR